jgi:anaerobic selenocysteine-containing dehydrogenase
LRATAKAVAEQMHVAEAPLLLLRTNKSDGFDCPGCAWPDKDHTSTFQFCENGAKAVSWEATKKRVTPEFFAALKVTDLRKWTDYELENEGRLTHPMVYDAQSDTYKPISRGVAFARIGEVLRSLPSPDMAEFYGLRCEEATGSAAVAYVQTSRMPDSARTTPSTARIQVVGR